ncbi:low affinity immunoglobulin gamma Fc region receptor III-A-like isoform X1 [Acipenser oxyrinchus oxyrinchus]|nr:low affinity immunoglobulin gamma Fc region receptor III-A-like isoform X1 [Acipenser oxyrinchus oxyrinchus]
MEVTSTHSYCTFLPPASWYSALAIGYRVSFTLIHFIVFTLLLLQYCRIQGKPRIRIRSSQQRGLSSPAVCSTLEWNWNSAALPKTGVELE